MTQRNTQALFRLLAVHRLGTRFLSGGPGSADLQEGLARVLVSETAGDENKKIAFFYLSLASPKLTPHSRRAIVEYASDPAHGDVVAQKGSARAALTANLLEVIKKMGE